MLVKIKDKTFIFKNENIQYYAFSSPTISFTFDISKYNYKKDLTDLWDNQSIKSFASPCKLDFFTSRYAATGCFITIMDMADDEIKLTFSCDYFRELSLEERRDAILNRILD
jgi:hypothetical protein